MTTTIDGIARLALELLTVSPPYTGYFAGMPAGFRYLRGAFVFDMPLSTRSLELDFDQTGGRQVRVSITEEFLRRSLAEVSQGLVEPDVESAAINVSSRVEERLNEHGGDAGTTIILSAAG
jgi:hypothetical protein